jgi:hypothetical protein
MGSYLSEQELARLAPAEEAAFQSPVPTQMITNCEFNPLPQTEAQRKVEGRLKDLAALEDDQVDRPDVYAQQCA